MPSLCKTPKNKNTLSLDAQQDVEVNTNGEGSYESTTEKLKEEMKKTKPSKEQVKSMLKATYSKR